jgi:uncharacterized protein YcfL
LLLDKIRNAKAKGQAFELIDSCFLDFESYFKHKRIIIDIEQRINILLTITTLALNTDWKKEQKRRQSIHYRIYWYQF